MRPPHTLLNESFRLQFPFVFRQLQSLQLLPSGSPFSASFPPLHFSGLPLSRPVAASASLSDPRCFRLLSLASVLGSDYSASVSSFPFSSCLRLTVASSVLRSRFRSFGLPRSPPPGFPCVRPRFSVLSFPVCFLSPFPDSLPQLFLRCLLPAFAFRIFRFPSAFFRPLPVCFRLLSLSVFPSFSSRFRLTVGFPGALVPLSLPLFPPSLRPDLSCLPSRFSYSAFLLVSFRPALLRSRSCSTGDPLSDLSSGAGA